MVVTNIAIVGANSYIARNLIYIFNKNLEEYTLFLYDYQEKHLDGQANYTKINVLDIGDV